MKLFEHPDFDQVVLRAGEHFKKSGLRLAMIEKDYYVTEVLRIVSQSASNKVIFKGGTSLSKGWGLINRFSEDIDLFLDPTAFTPAIGKNAIDRELKNIRDEVSKHPALTFETSQSKTIGGFGRSDIFSYKQHFSGPGEVANRVILETGTASGREPISKVKLQSYLGIYLKSNSLTLGAEDEEGFELQLLHFRRTFVEKLFAIHSKVELIQREGRELGTYARHYYDLFQLSNQPEVLTMLKSDEYQKIKDDYDQISRRAFSKSYFYPLDMKFANSEALFPKESLHKTLGNEYEKQCKILCYGQYPTWNELLQRFEVLRKLL